MLAALSQRIEDAAQERESLRAQRQRMDKIDERIDAVEKQAKSAFWRTYKITNRLKTFHVDIDEGATDGIE